jgi:ParB family chromosome partitioning protein
MPRAVQQYISDGRITFGAAKVLMGIQNPIKLENAAKLAANDNLTVKDIEKIVANPNNLPERKIAPNVKIPGVWDVAQNIGDYLETHVDIKLSKKSGKLIINFSNGEDLNRILKKIAPEIEGTPYA